MPCSYLGQLVHSLDLLVPFAVQPIAAAVSGPAGLVFAIKLCISDSRLIKV